MLSAKIENTQLILYFPIVHNTLCLPPQILHKPLFFNAPGSIAFSQEHFKTISYAKFGGQTECIMGNWKIVNRTIFIESAVKMRESTLSTPFFKSYICF